MKKHIKTLPLLFVLSCLSLAGCSTDTEYVESLDLQSIYIAGTTNNTIAVHTSETYQIEMAVMPENAKPENTVTYQYQSGDSKVFTISPTGLITGISIGEAVLTVTVVEYPDIKAMAIVKITDRYFNITSISIASGYETYSLGVEKSFKLSAYITVKPDNASNPAVQYKSSNTAVASVSETGIVKGIALGTAKITITPVDGSPASAECIVNVSAIKRVDLNRTEWTVTTQTATNYGYVPDGTTGLPEHLFDDLPGTFLSLVKPGKNYGSVPSQSSGFIPSFTVDMKSRKTFDYVRWQHRGNNSINYLRVYGINIEGSNDGTTFTPINTDGIVWIPNKGGYAGNVQNEADSNIYRIDIPESTCQYVKVSLAMWSDIYSGQHPDYPDAGAKSGSTMQVSEFGLGYSEFE